VKQEKGAWQLAADVADFTFCHVLKAIFQRGHAPAIEPEGVHWDGGGGGDLLRVGRD